MQYTNAHFSIRFQGEGELEDTISAPETLLELGGKKTHSRLVQDSQKFQIIHRLYKWSIMIIWKLWEHQKDIFRSIMDYCKRGSSPLSPCSRIFQNDHWLLQSFRKVWIVWRLPDCSNKIFKTITGYWKVARLLGEFFQSHHWLLEDSKEVQII